MSFKLDTIFRLTKAFILFIMLPLAMLIVVNDVAAGGSAAPEIRSSISLEIGTWDLAWPLDDYRVSFYFIPGLAGESTLSWTPTGGVMASGDTVQMSLTLERSSYNFRMDMRVLALKKSTTQAIVDETFGLPLGSINVPGRWESPSLSFPVLPLEGLGIPAEISIFSRASLKTDFVASLRASGMRPETASVNFDSSKATSATFVKEGPWSAQVGLTETRVRFAGNIAFSLGLSVLGIPIPVLKIDLATIPVSEWAIQSAQNYELATFPTSMSLYLVPTVGSVLGAAAIGTTVALFRRKKRPRLQALSEL